MEIMRTTFSSYPWFTILFTILIGLLTLRLFLSYIFSIILPSLSIGRISLTSSRNISWTPPHKKRSGLDLFGVKVSIAKVGWSGFGSKNCGTGWLVLRIQGLKVFIPRSVLLQRSRARRSSSASNSSDRSFTGSFVSAIPSRLSNLVARLPVSTRVNLSRLLRLFRKKILHPCVILFSITCTKLTAFLSLLALEVELSVELEDVLVFKGIVTAGIEVIKGEESRIGGWVGLEKLKISEPLQEGIKDVVLAALCMQDRLVIRGSSPLDPTTGIGGLLSSKGGCFRAGKASVIAEIKFTEGQNGVHLRLYEIKRILENIEDIMAERKKLRLPMEVNNSDEEERGESLLFYLQSISLSLPQFVISAHYDTPPHILAIQPNRPLPQSVGFVLTVKGIEGKIIMAGMSDEVGVKKEHMAWFGKNRNLAIRTNFGWKEIEGRIKIDGSEEDILPDSAKAFTIGSSTLLVTSTWLPPNLSSICNIEEYPSSSSTSRDFNDETVVLEGSLGVLRGHATFETLDSAVRIFNARPRSQRRTFFSESPSPESQFIRGFPRVIGTITAEGVEIRIQAPTLLVSGSRIDTKHFYRSWTSPDVFCVSFPNGSLSFGGEYTDRSIVRTDSDRRNAKRLSHKKVEEEKKEGAPDRKSIYQEWAPDRHLENVLGVIPPASTPPLLQPQPRTPYSRSNSTAVETHLDIYSLQYSMRFNLSCDLLNIFILATNDGSVNAQDAASWLDGIPILPSDPIRLDIFTLGPVELSSWHKLLGSEYIPPHQSLPIASLDTVAHTGEINALVEEIGVDLWRPPVMSSLKDLFSSFASAAAPSSLRTPSSFPPPSPYRPIVNSLPLEVALYLSIATIDFRIAGSDPMNDSQTCRGVAGRARGIIVDYIQQDSIRTGIIRYPHRQSLDLREDIRVEANANIAENSGVRQALIKVTASQITIDPVVNAKLSRGHVSQKPSLAGDAGTEDDWELRNRAHISDLAKRRKSILPSRLREASKGILNIPEIAFRMKISNEKDEAGIAKDQIIISLETELVSGRISLFNIYLCLVAISSLRSLDPNIHSNVPPVSEEVAHPSFVKRPPPLVNLRVEITDLHVYVDLPTDVKLFLHTRRLRLQHSISFGVVLEWDSCLLAGESPTAAPKWEDLIRLRVTTITAREGEGKDGLEIRIASDTARLRIPFRYVIARIIDNAVNLAKVTKQLIHQHIKGKLIFVLEPRQEEAKKVPKIEINIKMFAVEIQDDPFETRLNIIWRAGYEEQSARLERRVAFEEKVDAIRKMEAEGEEDSEEENEAYPSRKTKFTGRHSIGIEEARCDLRAYDSSHWVKRMRNAIAEQGRREEALTRRLYGIRHTSQRPDTLLPVELLPTSRSAPLARATFHGLRFVVNKHSYPPEKLPDFLHEVGKGLPRDTKFTLLVPLHLSWKMDEVRCQLRDYPLPLLHIPPVGGDDGDSSWECESDFVVAEEIGAPESVRRVPCSIAPAQSGHSAYTMVVPRSAMTVKTYATPIIRINSPEATRIGWGNSVAPAIQDVARVIDSLSKASPDPSDRLGFWDKIRLQLHWQVKVLFEGEGPLHFHLKGTRDPYALMGFGAGFSKSWRGNVKILLGLPNPDQEFMQVESDEYILGIPNLRDYVDNAASGLARDPTADNNDDRSTQHSSGYGHGNSKHHRLRLETDFVKVCAKFINGVRWGMGAVLERACTSECSVELCRDQTPFHRQCRFFTFNPHWSVVTRTAETAKGPDGIVVDSFKSFRSDFIHFSISLTSPLSLANSAKDSTSTSPDASEYGETGYNSLHFSPQASTHFWAWWKLFDGTMSLPIRQGKLFPSAQAPTKKFGKHCATIKYRFSLAPLFMSHTYKQETWEEWASGQTSLLGVKGKVARFKVDLHQREQEDVIRRPNSTESKTILHKAFYRAYVDCEGVDLRVISAIFQEPEKRETIPTNLDIDFDDLPLPSKNHSVADDELDWIDLDDFVDAVYTIPDRNPQLQVLPFLVCPRFTYRRQIDVKGSTTGRNETSEDDIGVSLASGPKSKFGKEPTHTCLMGSAEETISVQLDCAKKRLAELLQESKSNEKETKDGPKSEIRLRVASISKIIQRMEEVRDKLRKDAELSVSDKADGKPPMTPAFNHEDDGEDNQLPYIATRFYEEGGEWENRYMIHNPNFQITNATRDVLLKYYYSSRERKGFVYHLSASAIKFIRDLTKEHEKKHRRQSSKKKSSSKQPGRKNTVLEDSQETNRLLDELVNGLGGSFWATSETDADKHKTFADPLDVDPNSLAESLPEAFEQQSGHLVLFIKPQIALQSDLDDKSIIILTAFRAELKAYSIMDTRTPDDPVNAHVLNTTFSQLQGLQAFYPRAGLRGNGTLFVPLETLIDLRIEPWGFDRVVPRTTAYIRYDKFNQLRMTAKGESHDNLDSLHLDPNHFQMGIDRVSVEFEKFTASANPDHFAAIYNVVTDLLLYSDPLQKSRSKKLEELVYTRDFSDLVSAIDAISSIQERLRSLQYMGQQYQVHLDELDEDGRLELFYGRAEFVRLSNELNLVIEAITRAQDFNRVNRSSSKSVGVQFEARAPEIVWHMTDISDIPFAKFSVSGVEFSWISKKDSSVSNRLIIRDLKALNSSPTQIFAEIIAKSEKDSDHELCKADIFAAILWDALAPVGGISIVEQFQIHLHPVRLQIEHRVGRQILNYVFSQRRKPSDVPPREEVIKSSRPSMAPSSIHSSYSRSTDSLPISKNSSRTHLPENRSSTALASSSASFTALKRTTSITEAWIADSSLEEGLDAVEMRARAALNRTFLLVEFSSTTLYLTYRSEKEDHSRLPDVYNIVYSTPSIVHHGKTWSNLDLLDSIKRDIILSVWSQKGALLGQFLSAAHRKLPLHDQRQSIGSSFKSRFSSSKSKDVPKPSVPSPLRKPLTVSSLPPSSTSAPVVPKLDFSTLSRSEIAANFSNRQVALEGEQLSEEPGPIDEELSIEANVPDDVGSRSKTSPSKLVDAKEPDSAMKLLWGSS